MRRYIRSPEACSAPRVRRARRRPTRADLVVVKSINSHRDPDNHDRLRLAAEPHSHLRLIDHYLPAGDNQRLLATCDAYVSLHRSEGFGIGMAEAMLRGKPVVATAYGGNTDFLNEETGFPVSYSLASVGEGAWPYDADVQWAQPDLDDAGPPVAGGGREPRAGR